MGVARGAGQAGRPFREVSAHTALGGSLLPRHVAASYVSCSVTPTHFRSPSYPCGRQTLARLALGAYLGSLDGVTAGRDGIKAHPTQPTFQCLQHCFFFSVSPCLCFFLPLPVSVCLSDILCPVTSGKLLFPSEPQFPHLDTGGMGLGFSSLQGPSGTVGPPLGPAPGPSPRASLCISGLSEGGQAWGCPPHSTALTPPLPFPQPPPLPVVLVELWESSGFWLTPTFYPRPFITLSQIFVLADKSLVLELSPGGQAVSAGESLDTIQPKLPTPTVHAEKLRPRERPGFS